MALTQASRKDRLDQMVEEVARALGSRGLDAGSPDGAKAILRIVREPFVRRVVQVYWTPFQADIPDECIGLHLEVGEPRVHWAEGYISPDHTNWFFSFHERPDGDVQLAYYEHDDDWRRILRRFFDLAGWYVLTATGTTWKDVVYEVDPAINWTPYEQALGSSALTSAVQESLKKSTIIWLRWKDEDGSERTMPVWFVYDAKAERIFVLSGERQQMIAGAEKMRQATVILRWKGKNAQVAEIPAGVRVIEPGPEWDEIAEKVAEKRLNIPGLPEETAKRWRDECVLLELSLRS
jgi:hypothetical protein